MVNPVYKVLERQEDLDHLVVETTMTKPAITAQARIADPHFVAKKFP
ncbi:hypothetical protein [Microcoleus sp. Pol11C3]